MSKLDLHEPKSTSIDNTIEEMKLSNIIFYTKEKFDELEGKRTIFNRIFPTNKESGFYMNQKIGNCYLIATINAMRLNPYFMEELYENISFSKEENIFETKVSYKFPDGEKVTVSIKDLKTQKEEPKKNNRFDLNEIDNLTKNILNKLVKRGNINDILDDSQYNFTFDSRNKKRIVFSNELIQEIKEQVISGYGKYYDFLEKQKEYKSVDAPIGYKILEALYVAKKTKTGKEISKDLSRESIILGKSKDVLNDFLPKDKWDLTYFSYLNYKDEEDIIDTFKSIESGNYIITTSILNKLRDLKISPFFSYKDYKMADGHAYSIVGFNKEKEEIEVVNPWDNNESMFFSKDDFFKLFTNITIIKRKD